MNIHHAVNGITEMVTYDWLQVSLVSISMYTFAICSRTWWLIGRFVAFRPKGHGFESRSSCHSGDLGQVFHLQLPVAFQHETLTLYLCCVGRPTPPSRRISRRPKKMRLSRRKNCGWPSAGPEKNCGLAAGKIAASRQQSRRKCAKCPAKCGFTTQF